MELRRVREVSRFEEVGNGTTPTNAGGDDSFKIVELGRYDCSRDRELHNKPSRSRDRTGLRVGWIRFLHDEVKLPFMEQL